MLIAAVETTTGVVCTLEEKDDEYIMTGGTGYHTLHKPSTGADRLGAHWVGFVKNNGGFRPRLLAGEAISVHRNQGDREAEVLAILGDEALIEYVMPNGTSSLNIVPVWEGMTHTYRAVSYFRLPKKWAQALRDQSGNWTWGNPQQANCLTPCLTDLL